MGFGEGEDVTFSSHPFGTKKEARQAWSRSDRTIARISVLQLTTICIRRMIGCLVLLHRAVVVDEDECALILRIDIALCAFVARTEVALASGSFQR